MQQTTLIQDANNADAQKHNFAHMEYVPANCLLIMRLLQARIKELFESKLTTNNPLNQSIG